ncbi:hypothetical protein D5S17_22195 [Pseudonocardiaceae bacterium YIM PH 21723]|nr:hypothetical protein D5S17_22195 [Pseudonocardiaceae bacterium YIM PH 21723]
MQKFLVRALVAAVLSAGLAAGTVATASAAPAAPATVASAAAERAPLAPALRSGQRTKDWSVPDYIRAWEKHRGRTMTEDEKRNLARGCIGVTVVNLDREDVGNPPLGLSFGSFETARTVQAALNEIVAKKPSAAEFKALVRKHPVLGKLSNVERALPDWIGSGEVTAAVFSKRFWSGDADYSPNANDQVNMSGYRYVPRPGYVNFDYGWYDESVNNWWHANHSEPGMHVYQSTLNYYSRPLQDFDEQVFSVAFARKY